MSIGFGGWITAACLVAVGITQSAAQPLLMTRGDSGQVGLVVETRPNFGYILETSGDGTNWVVLREGEGTGALFGVEDWVAPVLSKRFYRLRHVSTPENDFFGQALPLPSRDQSVKTWNFFANREVGEPNHTETIAANRTIWFKWQAPANGHAFVDTIGSFFETALAVYQGSSLDALTSVAQGHRSARMLAFDVAKDQEYWIAVGSAENRGGVVHLNLEVFPDSVSTEVDQGDFYLHFPAGQKKRLSIKKSGWELTSTEGQTETGVLTSAEQLGDVVVYKMQTEGRARSWKMHFKKKGWSGDFVEYQEGREVSRGKIRRFHRPGEAWALNEIDGVRLAGTRLWTTTGTSGQTHYYTFHNNGRFHDTDNDEQAAGKYLYQRLTDKTARLVLSYEGPGDFTGDHHAIEMTFSSPADGVFTSEYTRNDRVKIKVDGKFDLME